MGILSKIFIIVFFFNFIEGRPISYSGGHTLMHFNDRRWSIEEPEEVESSQAYLLFYEINTNLSSNEIEQYTQQVAKTNRSSDINNIAFL